MTVTLRIVLEDVDEHLTNEDILSTIMTECAPQAVILTDVPDPTCPDECLPLQVLSAEATIE